AAQARVLDRFDFAVNEGGFAFLGKAELLLTRTDSFAPLDLKQRVFVKAAGPRRPLWGAPRAEPAGALSPLVNHVRTRDAAFDAAPVPQMVIDPQGVLALANGPARALFRFGAKDLGRPLHEVELNDRPVELGALVRQSLAEGRP